MRLPTLLLMALLVALPAVAQETEPKSQTHTGSVTIDGQTYIVQTWVNADGTRSQTSVTEIGALPGLDDMKYVFSGWMEAGRQRKARAAEQKRLKAEQESAVRVARVKPRGTK